MRSFSTFRRLGPFWFEKIIQELADGVPAPILARRMQIEWLACRYLPEDKLANKLRRLRRALSRGELAELVQQAIGKSWPPMRPDLDDVDCLATLIAWARRDGPYVKMLLEFESDQGGILPEVVPACRKYRKLLARIQELRFEQGLDVDHAPKIRLRRRSPKEPVERN